MKLKPKDWLLGVRFSAYSGLVKKLGLDRRQVSFVLAPARTRLTPSAEAAASQNLSDDSQGWKIIYLQVLRLNE